MSPFDEFLGQRVSVTFWDHCISDDQKQELIEIEAEGKLVEVGQLHITLRHWHAKNIEDNDEVAVIAKALVTGIIEYSPRRAKRFY